MFRSKLVLFQACESDWLYQQNPSAYYTGCPFSVYYTLWIHNVLQCCYRYVFLTGYFRIDVTFEMRTSEYVEICISIDKLEMVARVFIWNEKKGKQSKVTERQRERQRVCVQVLVKTHNSVDQHPQQHQRERNTSVAINDCRHLWSISEEVWEFALMRFLTVGLLFSSDIWIDDSSTKRIASLQYALFASLAYNAMPKCQQIKIFTWIKLNKLISMTLLKKI